MPTHAVAKKPKKSLASFRKKHEEKLLALPETELAAEVDAALNRLGKAIKKHS